MHNVTRVGTRLQVHQKKKSPGHFWPKCHLRARAYRIEFELNPPYPSLVFPGLLRTRE